MTRLQVIQLRMKTAITILFAGNLLFFQNCSPTNFTNASSNEATTEETITDIVCDGVSSSADCDPETSKVTGEIYALSAEARDTYGSKGVDTYFTYGDKIAVTLLMDQIFIPTRSFSDGFPVSNESGTTYLENNDGELLTEYFALRLKTTLSLTADQGAGIYQLALLSDDGSRLYRLDTGEEVVDNNSTHSTSLGCGKTISLSEDQSIPIQIDYYQGPKTQIALTLMWRKVSSTDSSSLSDPLCGVAGNSTYFGPTYDDMTTAYGYGQLLSRGWSAVSAENLSHYVAN